MTGRPTEIQSREKDVDAAFYAAQKEKNRSRNLTFAARGVIFRDIDSVYIEEDVSIGADTYIEQSVSICGSTVIGARCTIGQGTAIESSEIGDGCDILQNSRIIGSVVGTGTTVLLSVIIDSKVGEHTNVGPYAYVRPGSCIGNGVKVGDFVEIKNSSIGNGTKVSHLTYVGDADLGADINLGCGVVFVNYDGREKHRSKVHDGAFIGCNVNIISPVEIGEEAYVAAGTTVTGDVPAGSLSVGREKQKILEGWVKRKGIKKER
ncbi:MAG: UDP-N-acetylglucosamine diphosphorylase [Clostridiales Family XIII bacterium]|jgi:bifunctional UDP-N-acetylglucosamine pyrophosphorylase/glucosamine-1-phosphate N-acetyltransferase|nr:UDP-N-acetylglucosamine diphosphorylase [Clostridiales Family XIII bacterium]